MMYHPIRRFVLIPGILFAVSAHSFSLLASPSNTVDSADYRIAISAVSSFESEATLAQAEIDFGMPVRIEHLAFVDAESGEEVAFYFVPEAGGHYGGWIFWEWEKMGFFETRKYILYVSEGEWSARPMGCDAIAEQVRGTRFLAPNYIFEDLTDGTPDGWELSGTVEVSSDEAFRGRQCIKLTSVVGTEPQLRVPRIPLLPETRYRLTFWYKVIQADPTEGTPKIAGDLWSRTADGQWRVRALVHRSLPDRTPEDGASEWRKLTATATTCAEAAFGTLRIWLHSKFSGVVLVDRVIVEQAPTGAPHRVEVGEMKANSHKQGME